MHSGLVLAVMALAALGAPASAAPSGTPAAGTAASGSLTLFSEPGLRGRHATYRAAAAEVERQGFVARSAASTGMWTLCEGGEVASRCQTVDGQAPELRFAPQLVRPGLNALALYDQPGLKGRRIVFSFPADRPAPFHARSARTWGGPWSLCERDFRHCQILDGKSASIDLVVGSVRPEPAAAQAPAAVPPVIPAAHAHRRLQTAAPARPLPVASPKPPRPPKLVHAAAHRPSAPPPRRLVIELSDDLPRHHPPPPQSRKRRPQVPPSAHAIRPHLLIEARVEARARHALVARPMRYARPAHHAAARAPVLRVVSDHPARRAHAAHRRLYRHVRMLWGGPDPYLYDADPRELMPEPW